MKTNLAHVEGWYNAPGDRVRHYYVKYDRTMAESICGKRASVNCLALAEMRLCAACKRTALSEDSP